MNLRIFFLFIILMYGQYAIGQEEEVVTEEVKANKFMPKEFSIPVSPLFDLLGSAPNQVANNNNVKTFKVDWSYNNWKVSPNIAIQAQPVWEIFYNKENINKYQDATSLARMLASIDVSVGTVQTQTWDRKIGGAIKIKLYNGKDPLLSKDISNKLIKELNVEIKTLRKQEKLLLKKLDTLTKPKDIANARVELRENDSRLDSIYKGTQTAIQEIQQEYLATNWNAPYVDLAYGKVNTYLADSTGKIRKLILNKNTTSAAWLNFGFGLGKRAMINGLARVALYNEGVSYTINEIATNEKVLLSDATTNYMYSAGINLKYGGPVYDFFVEIIREGRKINTVEEIFAKSQAVVPSGNTLVANSLDWEELNPFTINIGGDWRISRNVSLNFGIRSIYEAGFKRVSISPIVNVSCLMR
jgi:hypothetical protein